MSIEELKALVSGAVPGATFEEERQFLNAIVEAKDLHGLAEKLRNDPTADFDSLFCQSGVDWNTHFYVVYHLTSRQHKHTLVVKAKIEDRENPTVDTVSDIWKTAIFHEREIYDLFGVKFNNHPDLRRIFLEEDWDGHPLRKDYTDENMISL